MPMIVIETFSLTRSQTSINNIPPPEEWTPEWKHHMENIDMSRHLAYIRCEHLAYAPSGVCVKIAV